MSLGRLSNWPRNAAHRCRVCRRYLADHTGRQLASCDNLARAWRRRR